MFRRNESWDHVDDLLRTATMSEREKVEARCMAVFRLALVDRVHVMTATQRSATTHADYFARIGGRMGVEVAQLPLAGSDSARSAAYRTTVVVGPAHEFLAYFRRGLRPEGAVALIEGEPPVEVRPMLSGYKSVRLS